MLFLLDIWTHANRNLRTVKFVFKVPGNVVISARKLIIYKAGGGDSIFMESIFVDQKILLNFYFLDNYLCLNTQASRLGKQDGF